MNPKHLWIGLLVFGLGAAAYAGLRSPASGEPAARLAPDPAAAPTEALPPGHPPIQGAGADPQAMPPGHPPIGPGGGASAAMPGMMGGGAAGGEAQAITWTMPARCKAAPNPSSMRIATYVIPHAAADKDDAEMSVSQAGGGTAANLDRWVGQFDEPSKKTLKKTERTAGGFKTTVVEIEGAFASGGMMGGPPTTKPGWALVGAIVETPGMAHFFKLTGPAATVKSARGEVDALLSSIQRK
jgi:hypothetical protein